MIEKFTCQQCGANEYVKVTTDTIQCNYCKTIYKVIIPIDSNPKVLIKKGANVVFGKNSNVTIKGGIKIEDGAHVQFLGKLEVIQIGDEDKIKKSIY